MNNIFQVDINDLPTWLVEMDSTNRLDAAIKIIQDIKDAPADSDFEELADADEIHIHVKLVAPNTTLDDFEKNHPEEFDDYF